MSHVHRPSCCISSVRTIRNVESVGALIHDANNSLKSIKINSDRQEHQEEMQDESDPARFLKPFTAAGLQAGPVSGKAGDLIVFDTALYHCGCPALSPFGSKLLRAVCIMSMAPVRFLFQIIPTRFS